MPKVDLSKCRVKFCPYVPRSKESLDDHVDHQHRNIRNELICPHCPSYTTKQMSNLNSHMSACHDPERVRLLCPIEGCGSSQASQRHLDDHVAKKHRGEGYMSCPVDDCTFRTQYQNVLELHIQSVHCEERSFKCSFEGCDYAAKRMDTLECHMRRHTGLKPYLCTVTECTKSFRFRQSLVQHLETHVPSKPWLQCTICSGFRTKRPSRLREHVNEVHADVKPFSCPAEDCTFTAARKVNLRDHINAVHEKTELFTCPLETCDFATYWQRTLDHHIRYNHTETGERVRNGQEYHCLRALEAGFQDAHPGSSRTAFHKPYAIRKEFLPHCRRKFIHVDAAFSIPERELLVLIECDEQQHKDSTLYSVRDELTRMQDATQGIRASGEHSHVLWIRFNPDTYTITADGRKTRMNDALSDRIARLLEFIDEFIVPDNDTDQDMSIAYFYYDVVNGIAAVTQHDDYFEELHSCALSVV